MNKIELKKGNLFSTKMRTLTITVNLVGKLGKGIALQGKQLYPQIVKPYERACESKELKAGIPLLLPHILGSEAPLLTDSTPPLVVEEAPKHILLFPTKRHWRNKSRVSDIYDGLEYLYINYYKSELLNSLAFPPLGCGNGGLDFNEVLPIMDHFLGLIDLPTEIYIPNSYEI